MAATKSLKRQRNSKDWSLDFRLVLVGKTGAGKSSSGNNILGGDVFSTAVSPHSVTRQCCKQTGEVWGRQVTVVDTPGLFDTWLPDHLLKREIAKCINMSAPGPHAILLVIKVACFTAEEDQAVRRVEEIFGEDAWRNTIVLFAHNGPEEPDQELLSGAGAELQAVLTKAGWRFHFLNNNKTNDRGQVLDLLEKVEQMVADNGGQYYSNYTYMQVVEMLEQREEQLRDFYRKKQEEQLKAVEKKFEEKLRDALQERQKVEERLQAELQEVKRYYHALESGVRHVVERAAPTDSMQDILQFHHELKLKFTS